MLESVLHWMHTLGIIIDPETLELVIAQRMDLLQFETGLTMPASMLNINPTFFWRCGPTGHHSRDVILSCIVCTTRGRYPLEDGHFTRFRTNRFWEVFERYTLNNNFFKWTYFLHTKKRLMWWGAGSSTPIFEKRKMWTESVEVFV